MDELPVTNEDYLQFVIRNISWLRSNISPSLADKNYLAHWNTDFFSYKESDKNKPVRFVSWFAARAYCRFQSKSLPTIEQWEYVASSDEKLKYAAETIEYKKKLLRWYSSKDKLTKNVGETKANYFGIKDLHELHWEWNKNFNSFLVEGGKRGSDFREKSRFCGSGSIGAKDAENYASFMRYAFRSSLKAHYTVKNLGFRCVKNI